MKVQYRKFDTIPMNYVYGDGYTNGLPFQITNTLPITTLASDRLTFEVEGGAPVVDERTFGHSAVAAVE